MLSCWNRVGFYAFKKKRSFRKKIEPKKFCAQNLSTTIQKRAARSQHNRRTTARNWTVEKGKLEKSNFRVKIPKKIFSHHCRRVISSDTNVAGVGWWLQLLPSIKCIEWRVVPPASKIKFRKKI
jgi:hypothetical protein